MTSKVRVGLLGCGRIAATHAIALNELDEADFVACCDTDELRIQAMAEQYNVPKIYTDMAAMFAEGGIDAVMVCTPHPAHEAAVVAAAEAGIHVLCEKPIAVSLAEADRMIEAADNAGIKFGVIFQRRFWPAAQRIRAAIDDGKIGTPILGECSVRLWRPPEYFALDPWRGKWATEGGGVLMNQAIHSIDHFQWFMGRAVEVTGRYANLAHQGVIDVEDTAVATVTFASGGLGILNCSSTFNPNFGFRVSVHGDKGPTVSVWELPEGQQGINDVWTIPGEEGLREVWEAEDRDKPGFPGFHALQIQEFLQAIIEDRDPAVTGVEARKSLAIIQGIYESSRTGLPVRL
jgi:UDP-N-acetyl-2-amino-2-deoxyglucuronate dehydrogenase